MITDVMSKEDLKTIAFGQWACVETGEVATVTGYVCDNNLGRMEMLFNYNDGIQHAVDWFDFQNDFVKL